MKQRVHEMASGMRLVLTDESGGGWGLVHEELRAAGTGIVHVYVRSATLLGVVRADHIWPSGRRADEVLVRLAADGPQYLVDQHAEYLCHRNPEPSYETLPQELLEVQFTIRPEAMGERH